ncbi:MAG: UBP-type zinc finger domain-containing protein [Flavobacteriales bacterium]|nr:UBP-type zinc finger domain-containing protein [Flavobacteriales bacterium]
MGFKQKSCEHLDNILEVKGPVELVCEECVKTGSTWVHLRTCQECGVTLCCDDSPNQHARKHSESHGHNVIASAEPGERWLWCYEHKLFKRY